MTFSTRDQAESIRTFQAGHEVDIYTCQTTLFDMDKQAVQQGLPIESLPACRPLVQTPLQVKAHGKQDFTLHVNGKTAHTFTGKGAFAELLDKLSGYRTIDRGTNQRALNSHQAQLSSLTNAPITQTRLPQSERKHLTAEMLPPVKTEKEHGRWFNGWRSAKAAGSRGVQWLRDTGLTGASVDVASTGINAPKPSRSTHNHAGTYGVDVAKTPSISTTSSSGPITTAGRPTENWGWQNVEDMQRDTVMRGLEQTINANRQSFSGMPQNPINYQSLWGKGVGPQVQLPPITVNGIELNHAATHTPQHKHLQMAGFVPDGSYQRTLEISAKALQSIFAAFLPDMSDHPGAENPMDHIKRIITPESVDNFVKSVPKGAIMPLKGIFTLMLPDMSDIPGAEDPKAHFKRFSHNALLKYDNIMQIDPHAFSAKAGEFVGEMFAFGALGKVIRVAEGISAFGMACEGGMVGLVVSEAHDTNKVAGVAFGFIGGAACARLASRTQNPLVDRVLTKPQELRPVYRSGFVNENIVGKLRNSVSEISPKTLKSLENRVSTWLGDGTRLIRNRSGDPIFLSQDKIRRVRFDFNRTYPHENPHLHFEKKLGEEWKNVARIYPKDLPHK